MTGRSLLPPVLNQRSVVARIHHAGNCARSVRAAIVAALPVSNNAKQVAPDPDMRANRQPDRARRAASTSAMTGASVIADGSRSLRSWAKPAISSARPCECKNSAQGASLALSLFGTESKDCSAAKTSLRGKRNPWIGKNGRQRRQLERIGKDIANAAHEPRPRVEADGHICAGCPRRLQQAWIMKGKPVGSRQQSQCRRSVA